MDGAWIVVWSYALALSHVLRNGVLDVHKQRVISGGKEQKMEAVYDYVTSAQFAQKLRAVFDAFEWQRKELEVEKTSTMQRWARHDKQLQSGLTELLSIGGEMQGLSQFLLPALEMQSEGDGRDGA